MEDVKSAVFNGHNVLILGQAGTGKTQLLRQLYRDMSRTGKVVNMTATSGIAATLLPEATTLHSFFGILDGRYTDTEVINRIINNPDLRDVKWRIIRCDVLMCDEVSMLSQKIFAQIEHLCRKVRDNTLPFGGMQVILSGDMYQLRPVPNTRYFDDGSYFVEMEEIDDLIPHKFVLQRVFRQNEGMLNYLMFLQIATFNILKQN